MNIDRAQVFGDLRRVFENYKIQTYKFRKNYSNPYVKKMISFLHSIIPMEQTRRYYDEVIPVVESMPLDTFVSLCKLAENGKFEILASLMKQCKLDR